MPQWGCPSPDLSIRHGARSFSHTVAGALCRPALCSSRRDSMRCHVSRLLRGIPASLRACASAICRTAAAYGVETPIHVMPRGLPPDRFCRGVGARFRMRFGIPADHLLATNVEQFGPNLGATLRNSTLRAQLSHQGRAYATREWSAAVFARKLADVYRSTAAVLSYTPPSGETVQTRSRHGGQARLNR